MLTPDKFKSALNYIKSLDLGYIIEKMISPSYPLPRWTFEDAKTASRLYKNFLILQVKYRPQLLVPTREIDEFWHNHILYTERYTQDCLHIFGHYLHHEPGEETIEELLSLKNHFDFTKKVYLQEFGVPLVVMRDDI